MRAFLNRKLMAGGALLVAAAIAAVAVVASSGSTPRPSRGGRLPSAAHAVPVRSSPHRRAGPTPAPPSRPAPAPRRAAARPLTVAVRILHMVDPARTMTVAGRVVPRAFDTIVRYPVGAPGRFPLIVFGHGYTLTPTPYAPLLDAWTKAGYVVAAPVFPLENENAPGGPNENDLPNQPGDMSLVISELETSASPDAAKVARLIDSRQIAVTGHSDGGDTALAVAYDPSVRDPRVRAAMVLSGAEDPFARPFAMPNGGPPLLAVQGTDDAINPPSLTDTFFSQASSPKYLLELEGASHLPPYSDPGIELTEVERVTIAFLDRYFKHRPAPLDSHIRAGSAGPASRLIASP